MLIASKMKNTLLFSILLLLVSIIGISHADDKKNNQKVDASSSDIILTYQPPFRGAPKTRVGGGTRGSDGVEAVLQVLAPDHVGLTTKSQPTLYWYASTPMAVRLDFSLINDNEIEPLLELIISDKPVSGIQRLNLGEHGISLKPGISYRWSIALVTDESSRSSDVVASGVIKRIEASDEFVSLFESSHGIDRVSAYANKGVWYDALDSISKMLDEEPQNDKLLAVRASLISQIGLEDIVN